MTTPASDPSQRLIAANRSEELRCLTRDGDALGHVHTFMIDKHSGQTTHAVLVLGGFMGLNKSYYPLPFDLLTYDGGNDSYRIGIDRQVLEGGPSWSSNPPTFDQAYADRVASYFGASSQS